MGPSFSEQTMNTTPVICGAGCPCGAEPDQFCGRMKLNEYSVRVVRPWVAPLHYTTRAANSIDAITQAMDLHGMGVRITARRVQS